MITRTMMMMTKIMITPKMSKVVLLPAVLMVISGDVHVTGMVGQLHAHVEGCCVTATPVQVNKLGQFHYQN